MKKPILLILTLFSIIGFNSCSDDESLEFVARASDENLVFTNDFLPTYYISSNTEDNIAERFVWDHVDFDAPVNVTYELQASTDQDFETFDPENDVIGITSSNNIAVTVGTLLDYAQQLGLDDDPATTEVPNSGTVFFRIIATTGTGDANAVSKTSEVQPLNITWIEQTDDSSCPSWWVVGEGAPDAGWGWATPVEFVCESGVYRAHINLTNEAENAENKGTFRFFTTEGNWDSGMNFPHFVDEGYTIDPVFEQMEDDDSNFKFTGTPGLYEVIVDTNNKTITLEEVEPFFLVGSGVPAAGWGWDNEVVMPAVDPYTWSVTTEFNGDGENAFRFFTQESDWNSGLNYPHFEEEGYTIDPDLVNAEDGDNNFKLAIAPGTYTITLNSKDKTITLE